MSLTDFVGDARYALRALLRRPGFALTAVGSLALGVGATTAIFSVVSGVLLQSLPYRDPASLASVSVGGAITAPMFEAFRQEAPSVEQAALFAPTSFNLGGEDAGPPLRVQAARVSAGLFDLVGIRPQLGRTFTADEDRSGANGVVLIGDGLWRSRFGADPQVVGRAVTLDGAAQTIIGVMPAGFQFPYGPELPDWAGPVPPADMWRPMALADWERTCAGCYNFGMLARLRPGVTAADAHSEMAAILERIAPQFRGVAADRLSVVTLQDALTAKVRTPLTLLMGAVALTLLIACVNIANLLLARGLERQGEYALRRSLGATPIRLARQVLTEALILALAAAGLAVPLAWAGIRAIVAIAPTGIPRLGTVGLDGSMLAFELGVATLSALAFGGAPALLATRRPPREALASRGHRATGGRARLRAALVVAEVALSVVLLAGSGLLITSFINVARTPLGFRADNVLTMRITFPDQTRFDDASRAALVRELTANCATLPGVASVAAVSALPLTGEAEGWGREPEGAPERNLMMRARAISPTYFQTMGIRLLRGRTFTDADRPENPVAIVSASAARQLWPGLADPTGLRIAGRPPSTVVGIVDDTRASGLDAEVRPYLYVPFSEFTPPEFALVIRTTSDPTSLVDAASREVWKLDPSLPVSHTATMRELVADSIAPRRFPALLMTAFGGFALLLAAVGIYGVLSYSVTQRTHEFGIRLALGATRLNVLGTVLRQAAALVVSGLAIGVLTATWLAPGIRDLLFGVAPGAWTVYVGCAALLAVVAAAASIIPAQRAAGSDPMSCLRYE